MVPWTIHGALYHGSVLMSIVTVKIAFESVVEKRSNGRRFGLVGWGIQLTSGMKLVLSTRPQDRRMRHSKLPSQTAPGAAGLVIV